MSKLTYKYKRKKERKKSVRFLYKDEERHFARVAKLNKICQIFQYNVFFNITANKLLR